MTEKSVLQLITEELESKANAGLIATHWEIGLDTLRLSFQSGLAQRVNASSFTLVGMPVVIIEDQPDCFRLIAKPKSI